jgi:hypothetical protein
MSVVGRSSGRQEYHADEGQDSAEDGDHQRELAPIEAKQVAADGPLVRMNEKGRTHSHLRGKLIDSDPGTGMVFLSDGALPEHLAARNI